MATVVGWALAAAGGVSDWTAYIASVALLLAAIALVFARRARIGGRQLGDLPWALTYLAATGLLRTGSAGEAALTLIPVVCIALTARDWLQPAIVIVGAAVACVLPPLLSGPSGFVMVRGPLVTAVTAAAVGIATRMLVEHVRHDAELARQDRQTFEQLREVVYALFASPDVRTDLCRASLQIGGANAAMLFEPGTADGAIRLTALAGADPSAIGAIVAADTPLGQRLREGTQQLIHAIGDAPAIDARISSLDLWEACGRPRSVLHQPLLQGSHPVGLLAVGWDEDLSLSEPRVAAIGLLTHEAALLLDRADRLVELAGQAATDPLTGLPNRRTWEARIRRAAAAGGPVTVAIIDLDNFKAYNDTHGHIAGDTMLRETAAAWSAHLRPTDLLARVGGEEFGVLFDGVVLEAARELAERLRRAVTHGQTCCMGLAQQRDGEPLEEVLRRADQALYEAKAGGRDLARIAP